MVGFYRHAGPAGERHALDDVRVEGALGQEPGALDLHRLALEHVDEGGADDLALLLRVGNALQLS